MLSVGQGQTVDAVDFAQYQASDQPPATFVNQLPQYRDLLYGAPNLTAADLDRYFKPAPLTAPPSGQVARVDTPKPGVAITRDKAFRVPRVVGATRGDVAFGVGYASAQDRLFAMDVLRSYGRSELGQLAGPVALTATSRMTSRSSWPRATPRRSCSARSTTSPSSRTCAGCSGARSPAGSACATAGGGRAPAAARS